MKKCRLVYIVGQPGAGKSTLMKAITSRFARTPVSNPIRHDVLWFNRRVVGAELGFRRMGFSGTDALGMNVQPRVQAWLETKPYPIILAEGDRLANMKFFQHVTEWGIDVYLIWLDTPDAVAATRRQARGSNQAESWIKGRQTKVRRLVESFGKAKLGDSTFLNGELTVDRMVEALSVHPVIADLERL